MYVDGVFDGSIQESLVVGNGSANNKLYLGQSNLGAQSFTGSLNNLNIYNRTLNECEIDSLSSITQDLSVQKPVHSGAVKFKVYPNPTDGPFFIDLNDNYNNITLIISDITGKVIQKKHYKNQQLISSDLPLKKEI